MQYFLLALGASAGLTYLVRLLAYRLGWVAKPRQDRWHQKPVALLGGVAIFLAYLLIFFLYGPQENGFWIITAAGALMFAAGLLDDFTHLRAHYKLLAQFVAATVLIYFHTTLNLTDFPLLNILFTYLWIIGITNALNLLDNMDGLCAGVALIAGSYRALFCFLDGHTEGVVLALILAGAAAGFLLFNFNPASIFMGDAGSLFLGFTLAGMNLTGDHNYIKGAFAVLLFPALVLLIPIFDTAFVTLVRKASGRAVSSGGRDHTSHRLVAIGMSERRAVMLLYGIAVIGGGIAFLLYQHGFSYLLFFAGLFGVGLVLFGIFLSEVDVYLSTETERPQRRDWFALMADITYKQEFLLMGIDFVLAGLAYYAAYALRFEDLAEIPAYVDLLLQSLPLVITIQLASNFVFGLYALSWRYAGTIDILAVGKAVTVGTVASVVGITYLYRFEGYSRSVFVIYATLAFLFICLSRFSFRLLRQFLMEPHPGAARVLIYGAGDGGELIVRELARNPALGRMPVGFLDDDEKKRGSRVMGIPVLGGMRDLERILGEERVEEVIVSTEKIPAEKLETLRRLCQEREVETRRSSVKLEGL